MKHQFESTAEANIVRDMIMRLIMSLIDNLLDMVVYEGYLDSDPPKHSLREKALAARWLQSISWTENSTTMRLEMPNLSACDLLQEMLLQELQRVKVRRNLYAAEIAECAISKEAFPASVLNKYHLYKTEVTALSHMVGYVTMCNDGSEE